MQTFLTDPSFTIEDDLMQFDAQGFASDHADALALVSVAVPGSVKG